MYTKLTINSLHVHSEDDFDMSCYRNHMHRSIEHRIKEMLELYPITSKQSRFYRYDDYLKLLDKDKLNEAGFLFLFEGMCKMFYNLM